jgi:hypothetical protein
MPVSTTASMDPELLAVALDRITQRRLHIGKRLLVARFREAPP